MIDLHTHTDESDGTLSPAALVEAARARGLRALGITDHDTLAGHDAAEPLVREAGLELVCGIEISTKLASLRGRSVHLLAYFPRSAPSDGFRAWLGELQEQRRDRNRRLAERLRSLGLDLELAEAEALGRSLTGRPHFARLLVKKGYVTDIRQAFHRYLAEDAPGYVERHEPAIEKAIERVREGGGFASLAHPVRLALREAGHEKAVIASLCEAGMQAIEVYHSDHAAADTERYLELARRYDLAVTGGSDFHGDAKPSVRLGRPRVGVEVLEALRARFG